MTRHRPDGSFFCYPLCANHRAPRCGPERIKHTRQMHSVIVHSTMTPQSYRRRKCTPLRRGLDVATQRESTKRARARMTSKKAWPVLKHQTCECCELFFSFVCCAGNPAGNTADKATGGPRRRTLFESSIFTPSPVRAAVAPLSSSSWLLESCFLCPSFLCVLNADLSPWPSGCHPNLWSRQDQAQATRNRKSR